MLTSPLTVVKPAPDLTITDPFRGDFLPAEGRAVALQDFYWQRLLHDGDIVLVADHPTATLSSTTYETQSGSAAE